MSRVGKYLVQLVKCSLNKLFQVFLGVQVAKSHSRPTANSMLNSRLLSVTNCSSQACHLSSQKSGHGNFHSVLISIHSTPISSEVLLPCLHSLARPVHFAQIFLGSVVSLDHHQQICKATDQMGLPREKADRQLRPTSLSPLTLMQNCSSLHWK